MSRKSIAYFPGQSALNSTDVLQALCQGLEKFGMQACPDDLDADAAVIWSVLWHGRMLPNKIVYQHYRGLGRPVIIVDVGALHRGKTWKIALDNITNRGFYGHCENLDWDRPNKLGITLGTSDHRDPSILLAAQHTSSLQVQDVNLVDWLEDQIDAIRAVSDRPLVLRPHPRCRIDLQRFQRRGVGIQQPRPLSHTYDGFDLGFNYHAVVNYNSGPGIQAAISGVRPIVDNSSLAHPVSVRVADIDDPYDADREKWLVEICHTEYTLEEIAQGSWLPRLGLV